LKGRYPCVGSTRCVRRVIIGIMCDCVSYCGYIHAVKEKRLELSTPNLVDIAYSAWQSQGMSCHWGQKVYGQGHVVIKFAAGVAMPVDMAA